MLEPWLDLDGFAARLDWASAITGIDLRLAGTRGSEAEIRDTAVAQPLLVATGLAAAAAAGLLPDPAPPMGLLAGHSVGEITAAALAGALSNETALAFVAARGRAMASAAAASPTGMIALLGGEATEVAAALERHGLTAANVNGAGQVVAAGPIAALEALAADPPPKTRLRRLAVAGAFHTDAMAPARRELDQSCAAAPVADPRCALLSNRDGALVSSGVQLRRRLIDQVSAPVRWDACLASMADLGVSAVIELPPAGTLTALIRRALPDVETLPLRTPEDLPAAAQLLAAHTPPEDADAPAWRLLVAPLRGTFRPRPVAPGEALAAGAVLAEVHGRTVVPVEVAYPGVLIEWLAVDGDPVWPGQPLARLHPQPSNELAGSLR